MHNSDPMDTRFLAEEMLAKAEGMDNYEALKGDLQRLSPIGGDPDAEDDSTTQWAAVKAIPANRAWAIKLTRCAAWKTIVADLGYARGATAPTAGTDGGVIAALQTALSASPTTRGPGSTRAGKTEAALIAQGMLADPRWLARLESTAPNAHATAAQLDTLRGQWDAAYGGAGFDFETYYYGTPQTGGAAATAGFRCQMMAVSNEIHQLVLQRMPDYTSTTATPNVDFLRTLYELHHESMTAKLNAHRGKNDGGEVYDTYIAGLHIDPANWGTGSLPAVVQSALPEQFKLDASMLGTEPEEQVQFPRMVTDTAMLQANAGHFVTVGQADSVQRFITRTLDLLTQEDPMTFSRAACAELIQLYDTILLPHSNDEMASAILSMRILSDHLAVLTRLLFYWVTVAHTQTAVRISSSNTLHLTLAMCLPGGKTALDAASATLPSTARALIMRMRRLEDFMTNADPHSQMQCLPTGEQAYAPVATRPPPTLQGFFSYPEQCFGDVATQLRLSPSSTPKKDAPKKRERQDKKTKERQDKKAKQPRKQATTALGPADEAEAEAEATEPAPTKKLSFAETASSQAGDRAAAALEAKQASVSVQTNGGIEYVVVSPSMKTLSVMKALACSLGVNHKVRICATDNLAANTVVRKQLEGEPEFLARMACRYGPECRYSHRHEATKVRDSHMRPAQSDQRDRTS